MRVVLVTGASGGIGGQIAASFAAAGDCVALQYHTNREAALQTAAAFPPNAAYLCVPCDLRDERQVAEMVQTIHARLGKVCTLINCAGVAPRQKLFSDTTDDEYRAVFDANVLGMLHVTRALIDDLRSAPHGAIVNLSSMWGVSGGSCEVLYSASKAAVIGFTKALAKELAPAAVTVNCVAPGFVPTAMNAHLSPDDVEAIRLDTPLERLGTPTDVADAVRFLAAAPFVTGQVLCVDGGRTI